MSEMIVRVGRSLAGHFGPLFDDLPKDRIEQRAWAREGRAVENTQADLLDAARAAIEAMREPDYAMWRAAAGETSYVSEEAWHAMIDAALSPEPPKG